MKKSVRLLFFFLLYGLSTNLCFSWDRRKDFSFGHYYEGFCYTFDSLELPKSETNYDIESVTVRRRKDVLLVMLVFRQPPVAHANDKIIIMIDNQNLKYAPTIFKNRSKKNPATWTSANSSVEYYVWETMSKGIVSGNISSTAKWIFDSKSNLYRATQPFIIYNVPASSIRNNYDNELPTDQLSLVIVFSSDDGKGSTSVMDAIPTSACTISTTENSNDTLEIDFSKGLQIPGLKLIW